MGQFYCQRCEQYDSSKNGNCIADPDDSWMMIHESCMTEAEAMAKVLGFEIMEKFYEECIDPILKEHRRER